MLRNLADVPRPTDDPRVHASGVDADRILLFGTGAAVGWGVLSHDLALPGALARAVARTTGRGADVDVVAGPEFVLSSAIRRLGKKDLRRYDAIVLTFGLLEALGLNPVREWAHTLDTVLAHLTATTPRTALFVLGIHPTTQIGRFDRMVAPIAGRHRLRLNAMSAVICEQRNNTFFIPFDPPPRTENNRYRTAAEYRAGGEMLAGQIAAVLNTRRILRTGQAPQTRLNSVENLDRRRSAGLFAVTGTQPEERFDRLTEFAQRIFHTTSAAIMIMDHDRFWTKSSVGVPPSKGALEESICFVAIRSEHPLVISDASLDPRFDGTVAISGRSVTRFYAGYRIEDSDGVPVGVLSVFDPVPRGISSFNRALLRDVALLVQKELWTGVRRS